MRGRAAAFGLLLLLLGALVSGSGAAAAAPETPTTPAAKTTSGSSSSSSGSSSGTSPIRSNGPDLTQELVIESPPHEPWVGSRHVSRRGPGSFEACLNAAELRPGQVVFQRSRGMAGAAKTMLWGAPPAKPAAVFYAYNVDDVSAAVACASRFGVNVSPAGGRQSLVGGSVVAGRLVVDMSNMTANALVTLPGGKLAVRTEAGNSGASLNAFIHDNAPPNAVVPMGSGTWTGVAGYVLGGGVGPLGRYLGYACDSLLQLEVVLADGSVAIADPSTNSDLFWASCGAGGGQFAVVTALTMKVSTLPNNGRATLVKIFYAPGATATVDAFMAFQKALPALDRRLALDSFRLGVGSTGPQFVLQGTFLGDADEAYTLLSRAGLLSASLDYDAKFASASDVPAVAALLSAAHPKGVLLNDVPAGQFYEKVWLQDLAPTYTGTRSQPFTYFGLPASYVAVAASGNLTASAAQVAFLGNLMRGSNKAARVVGGRNYGTGTVVARNRLTGVLPKAAVEVIVAAIGAATEKCDAGEVEFCYLLVGNHVLGGAYTDTNSASSVPFRRALLLLNFGFFPAVDTLPATAGAQAVEAMNAWGDNLIKSLALYLGAQQDQGASVNYMMDDPGPKWHNLYWGRSTEPLRRVKAKYDPRGRFDKPWTITMNGAAGR